ncbi:hypothetical protein GCM10020370_02990 [Paenibacillus hodogayensis]
MAGVGLGHRLRQKSGSVQAGSLCSVTGDSRGGAYPSIGDAWASLGIQFRMTGPPFPFTTEWEVFSYSILYTKEFYNDLLNVTL